MFPFFFLFCVCTVRCLWCFCFPLPPSSHTSKYGPLLLADVLAARDGDHDTSGAGSDRAQAPTSSARVAPLSAMLKHCEEQFAFAFAQLRCRWEAKKAHGIKVKTW